MNNGTGSGGRGVTRGKALRARRLAVAAALAGACIVHGGPAPAASNAEFNPFVEPDPLGNAQLPAVFTVQPGGFDPATGYVLTIDGVQHPYTIDGNSDFTFDAAPGCGRHTATIALANPDGEGGSESVGFAISCFTVTPASLAFSSQPVSLTLHGTDWFPNDLYLITVSIDGKAVGTTSVDQNTNDIEFTTRVTAAGLGCGAHTVTADQFLFDEAPSRDVVARSTFQVTGCPVSGSPVITANPSVFTEGTLTHVTGAGFTPNQPVALGWHTAAGAALAACSPNADSAPAPTADAGGKLDMYCFARPHAVLGTAQIVATQGARKASAAVVVEGGSMQPSAGDQFVFRR